ncbi:CASP-like protein 1D1 [Magnolia sinica]|uniref:CASP-like protein 1D1 n=1 Tax=Magnolia sinica TaxID=86752 RepID=UPI00265957E6|nr:CASP-like protein 1D1 [Magnolia sinica]
MASTDKPSTHDSAKTVPESQPSVHHPSINLFMIDLSLRLLLFASTVTAIVVMVTSKQTEMVIVSPLIRVPVARAAKFNHSPAFIYFVAALSIACLYSILTLMASFASVSKRSPSNKLLFLLAIKDALMAALVASATGTAGGVAYIGMKGNKHVGWTKICGVYDKFCRHIGSSIALAVLASTVLVLLVMVSTYSLYRRSR